jgi:DNA-binding MarR family transcriptional regulator
LTKIVNWDYYLPVNVYLSDRQALPVQASGIDRKPRIREQDIRLLANQKSLLHPLSWLAEDFRKQIRQGLHARGHQLQASQAKVVVHLELEGSRLTDLAIRAGISKQAMGKLVDELEKLGYLRRQAHADGRAKTICFTERGRQLLEDSRAIVESIWNEYSALMGEQRLQQFRNELQELFLKVKTARRQSETYNPSEKS